MSLSRRLLNVTVKIIAAVKKSVDYLKIRNCLSVNPGNDRLNECIPDELVLGDGSVPVQVQRLEDLSRPLTKQIVA